VTSLAEKLRILEGTQALALAAPRECLDLLSELPEGAKISTSGRGPFGVVLACVLERRDVEGLFRQARSALGGDGVLWMAYPKKSSKIRTDLTRDQGWEVLADRGWAVVDEVAVNETWTALRFEQDPALKTERELSAAKRAAEKPTVSLRGGGRAKAEPPERTQRREAATVSLRGPGLLPDGEETPESDDSSD
jgi:hypothetical protein